MEIGMHTKIPNFWTTQDIAYIKIYSYIDMQNKYQNTMKDRTSPWILA